MTMSMSQCASLDVICRTLLKQTQASLASIAQFVLIDSLIPMVVLYTLVKHQTFFS